MLLTHWLAPQKGCLDLAGLTLTAGERKAPTCSHQAAHFKSYIMGGLARSDSISLLLQSHMVALISPGARHSLHDLPTSLEALEGRVCIRGGPVAPGLGGDPCYQFSVAPVPRVAGSLHWVASFAASSQAGLAFSLRANQGMSGNDCDQSHYPRAQPGRKHSVLLFYE